MTSRLLINEPPLQVLPSLAVRIGLNKAILLQQIHYWLVHTANVRDGRKWVYNSVADWQKQLPFWSERTIRYEFAALEKEGLILTGNFNQAGFDRTKWYTIDYDALNALLDSPSDNPVEPSDKSDESIRQGLPNPSGRSCRIHSANLAEPIPETTQETTSESQPLDPSLPPVAPDQEAVAPVAKKRSGKRVANPVWDALVEAVGAPILKTEQRDFGLTVSALADYPDVVRHIPLFKVWWERNRKGYDLTHRCYRNHWTTYVQSLTEPDEPEEQEYELLDPELIREGIRQTRRKLKAEFENGGNEAYYLWYLIQNGHEDPDQPRPTTADLAAAVQRTFGTAGR